MTGKVQFVLSGFVANRKKMRTHITEKVYSSIGI